MDPELIILLDHVSKLYDEGASVAVRDLTLSIRAGEFLALLGASGCGKTTTLKMINGLIAPSSGRIVVEGRDLDEVDGVALRRRIGYVFQGVGLFPHLDVARNVAVVPTLLGWDRATRDARVDELLEAVNLEPLRFRRRYPRELSGGQRQRVGIARALAGRPKIILMDEPFGALDPINRDRLQDEYRKIHEDLNLTTVMVTHDITESLLLADRIAVMSGGALVRLGTPRELLEDPGDAEVMHLIETPKRQSDRLGALFGEGRSIH